MRTSASTPARNTIEMTPFRVKKATFTRDRWSGWTIEFS